MSIVGTWELTANTQMGEQKFTLTLNADGTGTSQSPMGSTDITGAEIDGDSANYKIKIDAMGRQLELKCSAKADGDTISGNIDSPMGGAPFTGSRKH